MDGKIIEVKHHGNVTDIIIRTTEGQLTAEDLNKPVTIEDLK